MNALVGKVAPRAQAPLFGAWVVALVLMCVGGPASADDFDGVRATAADAAYLGVVVPIDLGLFLIDPAPHARESDPFALDLWARDGLDWRNGRAARTTSDWLLRSFLAAPLVAPPAGNLDAGRAEGRGVLVGTEAMATTLLLTTTIKHLARRERPDALEGDHDRYASFFSGHTSMAFASATMLTIYAHEYDWGGRNNTGWVVPATAYTLAGFTGYLRVAGRRHWLTDVLAGAVVGTGSAYLTYALRAR